MLRGSMAMRENKSSSWRAESVTSVMARALATFSNSALPSR